MKKYSRWEFPEWVEKLDNWLYAVMPMEDIDKVHAFTERLSELCDYEEKNKDDIALLHGVDYDKEQLINEIVAIYAKHRNEAEQYSKSIKL